MGIFSRSKRLPKNSSGITIIAAGTKIRGVIGGECRVIVDGEFMGPISSTSAITIGQSGLIEGDVTAKKLVVIGSFSGTADCKEIHILHGGRVVGKITCSILVVEKGGFFDGENKVKKLSPDRSNRLGDRKPLVELKTAPGNVTAISEGSKKVQMGSKN
jgi:cytoskeletal protein CcmA (bactofilin family)